MMILRSGWRTRLAGEERLFHLAQFAGDAVLLQHLRVTENGEKNFLGEDVLDEHFIHVVGRDGGIDGRATEIKERFAPLMKGAIGLALLENHAAQGGDDAGDVVFETLDGQLELAHLGMLKADIGGKQFVESFSLGKWRGDEALAVLIENGRLRIFKEDV